MENNKNQNDKTLVDYSSGSTDGIEVVSNEEKSNVLESTLEILKVYGVNNQVEVNRKIIDEMVNKSNKGRFKLRDDDDDTGINTNLMGGLSLLILINSKFEKDRREISSTVHQVVKDNMEEIFDYADKYGYDFSPYVKTKQLVEVFQDRKFYSVETLTWMISYLVQLRKADRQNIIQLTKDESLNIMTRLGDTLLLLIGAVVEVPIPTGNVLGGWNFVNGCKFASIYYTAIVVEALSEIDDTILVRDFNMLEVSDPDYELLDLFGTELVTVHVTNKATNKIEKRIVVRKKEGIEDDNKYAHILEEIYSVKSENCIDGLLQNTSKWIWYKYSEVLKNNTFKLEKHYSNDEVFYIMYLLEIIIVSYTEYYIPKKEVEDLVDTVMFYLDKKINKINESKVNKFGKQYYRPESEGLEDGDDESEDTEFRTKINRVLSDYVLYGPSLTPLRIKLGSMYALYFTQYPDKKMAKELELLMKNKSKEEWSWDIGGYNLMATEKSIEALNDFFTYYNLYEEKYFDMAEDNDVFRSKISAEVEDEIKKSIIKKRTEELNLIHEAEINEYKNKIKTIKEDLSKTEYSFYHQMEDFIKKIVDERIAESIETHIFDYLSMVDELNRTVELKLNDDKKKHVDLYKKLWVSTIFSIGLLNKNEFNGNEIMSILENDIHNVIDGLTDVAQEAVGSKVGKSAISKMAENLLK